MIGCLLGFQGLPGWEDSHHPGVTRWFKTWNGCRHTGCLRRYRCEISLLNSEANSLRNFPWLRSIFWSALGIATMKAFSLLLGRCGPVHTIQRHALQHGRSMCSLHFGGIRHVWYASSCHILLLKYCADVKDKGINSLNQGQISTF